MKAMNRQRDAQSAPGSTVDIRSLSDDVVILEMKRTDPGRLRRNKVPARNSTYPSLAYLLILRKSKHLDFCASRIVAPTQGHTALARHAVAAAVISVVRLMHYDIELLTRQHLNSGANKQADFQIAARRNQEKVDTASFLSSMNTADYSQPAAAAATYPAI